MALILTDELVLFIIAILPSSKTMAVSFILFELKIFDTFLFSVTTLLGVETDE